MLELGCGYFIWYCVFVVVFLDWLLDVVRYFVFVLILVSCLF